jgi:Poly(A) polymerase catalytic subunit
MKQQEEHHRRRTSPPPPSQPSQPSLPRRQFVHGDEGQVLSFSTPMAPAPAPSRIRADSHHHHSRRADYNQQQPTTTAPRRLIHAYTPEQTSLIEQRIDAIKKDADYANLNTVEPTLATRRKVMEVIMAYIQKNERKVYGGSAINEFIKRVDASEAIYDEATEVPDVDFYSSNPVEDIKALCDTLHAMGIKPVTAREAQHVDTFTLFVMYVKFCDISYVQTGIYRRIPTRDMNGIKYVTPDFMFIDFLRIINDPLMSYWRLDKNFPRFAKLQQFYPLEGPQRVLNIHTAARSVFGEHPRATKALVVRRIIAEFLPNSSAVIIGLSAYNCLMDVSGTREFVGSGAAGVNNAVVLELLTVEFAKDASALYELIKSEVHDIQYTEYHPFYDFLGHRAVFSLPNVGNGTEGRSGDAPVVLRIFDNKHKCVPFMQVPFRLPVVDSAATTAAPQGPLENTGGEMVTVRVGTFTVIVMYMLIMRFRVKVENRQLPVDGLAVTMYDNMVSNLYNVRHEYLSASKQTIFDTTPFKEFVIPCVGEAMHMLRINQMVQDARYRRYRHRGLRYDPEKSRDLDPKAYPCMNSSGNEIMNPRDRMFNPPGTATHVGRRNVDSNVDDPNSGV